jgi:hypothetical protein
LSFAALGIGLKPIQVPLWFAIEAPPFDPSCLSREKTVRVGEIFDTSGFPETLYSRRVIANAELGFGFIVGEAAQRNDENSIVVSRGRRGVHRQVETGRQPLDSVFTPRMRQGELQRHKGDAEHGNRSSHRSVPP